MLLQLPPPPVVFASPPLPGRSTAPLRSDAVVLKIGRTQIVQTDEAVDSVINSNTKAVTVNVRSRHALLLFGDAEGRSEVRLLDKRGRAIRTLDVTVETDESALEELLAEAVHAPIRVRRLGASAVLSGEVANAGLAALAGDLAQKTVGAGVAVVNLVTSRTSDQVTVAVRVLEVRRSRMKSIGVKWAAMSNRSTTDIAQFGDVFSPPAIVRPTDQFSLAASATFKIGKTLIDSYIDLLRTEGEAKLLAAPSIVSTSGKAAKFLAGGEFPVPVPNVFGTSSVSNSQNTNTFSGLIYKQYGISLAFTATLTPGWPHRLHVAPEVSSIDYVNSIQYGGNKVPALSTRRAEADLRLASGESVVFAGLSSRSNDDERTRLPVGGRSVLDFFAGPSSKSSAETELIIIVTPQAGPAIAVGEGARSAEKPPA